MLTEERRNQILKLVAQEGSASVQMLMEKLDVSESTIRRDLSALNKMGVLNRVHGGAVANNTEIVSIDQSVKEISDLNLEAKRKIAQYAVTLIEEGDCVFIDAGTTTGFMIDYLTCNNVVFVTNAVDHARRLVNKGYRVYLPGGYLKPETEAIVGSDTYEYIQQYNFSKAFLGANGISNTAGLSTPDPREAKIKKAAYQNSREHFILADSSKFGIVSTVTFAPFKTSFVITNEDSTNVYTKYDNVYVVKEADLTF